MQTNWHSYGLEQAKGAFPHAPLVILVHIASVWVPYTSEAKEAIAAYPEIVQGNPPRPADVRPAAGRVPAPGDARQRGIR